MSGDADLMPAACDGEGSGADGDEWCGVVLRRALPVALVAGSLALIPALDSPAAVDDVLPERSVEPVVLTGAQLPGWSRLPAVPVSDPDVRSGRAAPFGDGVRDAHNGTLVVPPDARAGVPVDEIAAARWDGSAFAEIPVQVDQRYPYFLANGRSSFSSYSGTDVELTYQWDIERWKMTGGLCTQDPAEGAPVLDPVTTLDDDDEIVFMASDAGPQAPAPPEGGLEVAVTDPATGETGYVYLARRPGGPDLDTAYVSYVRDVDADEWIDRNTFARGDTEQLGTSNTGYGPNITGTVCTPDLVDSQPAPRIVGDRFPRDGVTVRTASYEWRATGRWMVRGMRIASASGADGYGPDLIDRWKGRAFQSSPDSSVSLVGFEDEQVNWEANSTLLGERVGPVRAIRETWGADSGTNVTKTETFYRDAVVYRYRMRVHPIPPDGLYTSWDYNAGVATTYFNALRPEGVAIDGVPDDVGQVDEVGGRPAFFDAPDPTFDVPSALLRWEQVAGAGDAGSLVYIYENKAASSLQNPAVVPFYRDDACWDDGTGDDPVARPWPGESSTDARVVAAYGDADCAAWQRQGAFGAHGLHYFFTGDTDNAMVGGPAPTTEADGQQWQFAVPMGSPTNVGEHYAQVVRAPLMATVR